LETVAAEPASIENVGSELKTGANVSPLPVATPYEMRITRMAGGEVRISGPVPNQRVMSVLHAAAQAVSGGAKVQDEMSLASGMPDERWPEMAKTALAALGRLDEGMATITDMQGHLTGHVSAPARRQIVLAILDRSRAGTWTTEINLPVVRAVPYRFVATLTARDAIIYHGYAPDDATRQEMITAIGEIAPSADSGGKIRLADGMPNDNWPTIVVRALGALATLRSGTLRISDMSVKIDGAVTGDGDLRRLKARSDNDWKLNVFALDPTPSASLIIEIASVGTATAGGQLPPGLDVDSLKAALPELTLSDGLKIRAAGNATGWKEALSAAAATLPRIAKGRILIGDGSVEVHGRMKPGFSAQASRAAVRAILPPGWRLEFHLGEAPPPSRVTLERLVSGEISIGGFLPEGFVQEGLPDGLVTDPETGLDVGGGGDPEEWAGIVKSGFSLLSVISEGSLTIEPGKITAEGLLAPGQDLAAAKRWLETSTGDGWNIDLDALKEIPAANDAIRINLASGESERLVNGYWLPVTDTSPAEAQCREQFAEIEASRTITFVAGSRRISRTADTALDRLTGITLACLAQETGQALEIGGHTDAVGASGKNQRLSEARARAVRDALIARGVPAGLLLVRGYGEEHPIADNDTEAGRALNRRISLHWAAAPRAAKSVAGHAVVPPAGAKHKTTHQPDPVKAGALKNSAKAALLTDPEY